MAEPRPTTSRSDRSSDPDRVVIVVDTREQEPYVFDPERVTIIRRKLPAGDYSLDGHETMVAAERKSLDDYVASVVRDRDRFARELRILSGYEVACVVVEATLEDVLAHRYRSDAHPNAVLGATLSIIVGRSVPVFFCGDRQIARRFVEGLLCRYAKKVVGE
jgi:DNA excision repair protein ERCC-4